MLHRVLSDANGSYSNQLSFGVFRLGWSTCNFVFKHLQNQTPKRTEYRTDIIITIENFGFFSIQGLGKLKMGLKVGFDPIVDVDSSVSLICWEFVKSSSHVKYTNIHEPTYTCKWYDISLSVYSYPRWKLNMRSCNHTLLYVERTSIYTWYIVHVYIHVYSSTHSS